MAKKKTQGKKPPPKCKAILLCDQVIVDAVTGKKTLVGLFENFNMPIFPCNTLPFAAFLELVDGIGRYEVMIELHDLKENTVIARVGPYLIEFPERVNKANFIFNILPSPIPHEGNYDFVILADGQEIDRQKFSARMPEPPGEKPS